MTGDTIRSAREARSWSQAHLAGAAGLSLRTVQRLERGRASAPETLLAVAGALELDIAELTAGRSAPGEGPYVEQWRAAITAALLMAPCLIFVAVNLLRSESGWSGPYQLLAGLGAILGAQSAFEILSPPLFIGGPLVALGLAAAAQLRIRHGRGATLTLTAVEIHPSLGNAAVGVLAAGSLGALSLYAVGEALGHAIR